jgi:YVTN family beta-propeller protein
MAQMVTVRIFRFFSFLFLLLAALTASDRVFAQVAAPPSVQTNITVGNGPYAVGVNVLSNKIYVVNQNGNSVSVIAGASNSAPSAAIAVGTLPYAVAVNPLTNMIYVANEGSNNVSVINGATDTVVATIPVGNNPYAIVANAATNRIYSINNGSVPNGKSVQGTVTVIDGSSNTVVTTIPVGFSPVAAAVNGVTNKIYVADLAIRVRWVVIRATSK